MSAERGPSTNGASAPDLYALPVLLTVVETAEVLRVGRGWVYAHAAELGAVKLGLGQTAPLRIPREGIRRIVAYLTRAAARGRCRRRRLEKA